MPDKDGKPLKGEPGYKPAGKGFTAMTEFRIDEISGVDVPAQEGALALIIKRAGTSMEIAKNFGDPMLTSNVNEHSHLLDGSENGGHTTHDLTPGDEFSHAHPWVKDNSGNIVIGMANGHAHRVLTKALLTPEAVLDAVKNFAEYEDKPAVALHIAAQAEVLKIQDQLPTEGELATLIKAARDGGGEPMEAQAMTDKSKAAEPSAVEKKLESVQAELAVAKAEAQFNDEQRAHYAKLDENGQESFRGLSSEQRQGEVEKARSEDPVIFTSLDGTDYRKSDDPRIVKMARERDEDRKELAVEKAERQREKLEKRAKEELNYLPGEPTIKCAVLKAIDGISDETERTGARALLKAGNDAASAAFVTKGDETIPATDSPEAQLDALANKRANANGESFGKAYAAVLNTPEGRQLLRESRS